MPTRAGAKAKISILADCNEPDSITPGPLFHALGVHGHLTEEVWNTFVPRSALTNSVVRVPACDRTVGRAVGSAGDHVSDLLSASPPLPSRPQSIRWQVHDEFPTTGRSLGRVGWGRSLRHARSTSSVPGVNVGSVM